MLRAFTAAALVGVAAVHLSIAHTYTAIGTHPLALSDLFYAQSATALVLALLLLVRPRRLLWLAVVGFAVASLAGLVYSRYRCLPVYGFHHCFQETWSVKGAKLALGFELATLLGAGAGLVRALVSAGSAGGSAGRHGRASPPG